MKMLGSMQKDLHKLQIQTRRIQVGIGQACAKQVSLTPRTSQVVELVRTLDPRTIPFPDRSIHAESTNNRIILSKRKNIGLNISALSNKTLHALHIGVEDKLRIREQCALNLISK